MASMTLSLAARRAGKTAKMIPRRPVATNQNTRATEHNSMRRLWRAARG